MKKVILFVFALIPMLASCNNNGNGFPNPFPEDRYVPTGFKFEEGEQATRGALTSTEQKLVNDSFDEKLDNNIYTMEHSVTIETRDYTRAFAGQFEQGYSISNTLETITHKTFRQDESSSVDASHDRRTVTHSTSNAIYDYSYGRNTSNVTSDEWHYYATKKAPTPSNELMPLYDAHKEDEADYIVSQIHSDQSSTNSGTILATATPTETNDGEKIWDNDPDEVFSIGLEQSEFLTKLSDCSSTPGADKQGNVILVKSTQEKYKDPTGQTEEGIYQLQDGRKYQAMKNSLTVSKLEIRKAIEDGPNKTPWEKDWYFVSYARRYTETTITSEEIQPNVPISVLSNPVVIHYTEEKHIFKTDTSEKYDDPIGVVNVEVED